MSSPCDYLIIFHKIHLKSEQNFNPVHFTLSGCCSFTVNLVVKPKLTSPTLVDNQMCVALSFFLSIYLSNCELGNYGDDSTGLFHWRVKLWSLRALWKLCADFNLLNTPIAIELGSSSRCRYSGALKIRCPFIRGSNSSHLMFLMRN